MLSLVAPDGPALAVTKRCAREDLEERRSLTFAELAAKYPVVRKFAHLRSQQPRGREVIQSLRTTIPIWSLHYGRHRAATMEDKAYDVVWLLAVAKHAEGDREDSYEHFKRLHASNRLLPSEADYEELIRRRNAEVIPALMAQLANGLEVARAQPGVPHSVLLPLGIVATVAVERLMEADPVGEVRGLEEVWVALARDQLRRKVGWVLPAVLSSLASSMDHGDWEQVEAFPGRARDRRELRYRVLQDVVA